MKKLQVILSGLSMALLGAGACCFIPTNSVVSINDDIVKTSTPSTEIDEEITEYTYKTYSDYFTDYDFTNLTLDGKGTKDSPFQVNSTEDFLWLLSGKSFSIMEEKRGVPSDYTEVAYLQSTGTQIINTGVSIKNSIRPYIKFQTDSTGKPSAEYSGGSFFGGTDADAQVTVSVNYDSVVGSKAVYFWHGLTYAGGNSIVNTGIAANTLYELEYRDRWYLNNALVSEKYQKDATNTSDITIHLFGRNSSGTIVPFDYGNLNIYSFKLYDGDEIIRDYVPCYRNSDKKPGMYDLVTNEFYTNIGEGEFSYGDYGTSGTYKISDGCYIELNSDVYLNDETFDENGNPSGGDGKVYSWSTLSVGALRLDGGNHTIYGLYRSGYDYGGLFGYNQNKTIDSIKNLKMANVYVKGPYNAGAFAWKANELENCHVISGTIVTQYGGAFANLITTMRNCSNYGYIIGHGAVGGLAGSVVDAYDCVNYGEINNVSGNWVGGLFLSARTITNCINYGNITSDGTYVGGLVCQSSGANFVAINCINYGSVSSYSRPSAFINKLSVDAQFINCKNYGKTTVTRTGGRGSQLVFWKASSDIRIDVINCTFDTAGTIEGLFTGEGTAKEIVLDRCTINLSSKTAKSYTLLSGASTIIVKNLVVNTDENVKASLISTTTTSKFILWNVLINSKYPTAYNSLCTGTYKADVEIKGTIIFNNKENKHYYGSNFSGFYFSWKLGKIGLVALDGRGSFQGTINEEWLDKKGFTKKSV